MESEPVDLMSADEADSYAPVHVEQADNEPPGWTAPSAETPGVDEVGAVADLPRPWLRTWMPPTRRLRGGTGRHRAGRRSGW